MDGRWFLVLRSGTLIQVGSATFAVPDLMVLRRERTTPESSGYWLSSYGNSVADHYVRGGRWAELAALPLREMCESIEAANRKYESYTPRSLPVPYGKGRGT